MDTLFDRQTECAKAERAVNRLRRAREHFDAAVSELRMGGFTNEADDMAAYWADDMAPVVKEAVERRRDALANYNAWPLVA